jgi:hypothetical protein
MVNAEPSDKNRQHAQIVVFHPLNRSPKKGIFDIRLFGSRGGKIHPNAD